MTNNTHSTFRMPPEWAPHRMTLMVWPDNRETWPGEQLNRAEHVYADILEALTSHEDVVLIVANEQAHQAAASMIQNRKLDWSRVRMVRLPVNDVWIRDYGPMTVLADTDSAPPAEEITAGEVASERSAATGTTAASAFAESASSGSPAGASASGPNPQKMVMLDWEYNAWGGKYPPYGDDNAIPVKLADLLGYPVTSPGMVLEGGSVDVNGEGCLLTTESVLLNPNRNPDLSREDIEQKLRDYLGISKVIWLKSGLRGDDTDGHIDDLARFVSPGRIVASVSEDPEDPNYEVLRENRMILEQATDVAGKPFGIIELPLPETRIQGTTVDGSSHVPASYANFYIANGCVLVPMYDERYDDRVLETFRKLFPGRSVTGIRANDLVWGQGSIHCITQQVPDSA
ncbi:agmatine deiminase family protein [Natronogracilivirga saccharolytica]|uniref:Agmatine deiminase family protein n=1 Tax=Natronogracilivirga saccharolytica TaxID=2812953 RepID=A0A8J7UWS7_9BACT|nr:agmatine deiminase family protein [Natronogracilivirga saccharolytica]MBP3192564.1 agmatine deiminase family protein [Natronogracilivirga saccharolytica]